MLGHNFNVQHIVAPARRTFDTQTHTLLASQNFVVTDCICFWFYLVLYTEKK